MIQDDDSYQIRDTFFRFTNPQTKSIQNHFGKTQTSEIIFNCPSNASLQKINRILTKDVAGLKNSSNTNLRAYGIILIKIMNKKQNLLNYEKSIKKYLESHLINYKQIINLPHNHHNIDYIKHSIVSLIDKLSGQPLDFLDSNVINGLQCIIILFRSILTNYQILNIKDFNQSLNTQPCFTILSQIFDIDIRAIDDLYLFYSDGYFISTHNQQQFILGNYYQNKIQMMKENTQSENNIHENSKLQVSKNARRFTLDQSKSSNTSEDFRRDFNSSLPTPTFPTLTFTPFIQRDLQSSLKKSQDINEQQQKINDQIHPFFNKRQKILTVISMIQSIDEQLSKKQYTSPCDSPVEFQFSKKEKQFLPISPISEDAFEKSHTTSDKLKLKSSLLQRKQNKSYTKMQSQSIKYKSQGLISVNKKNKSMNLNNKKVRSTNLYTPIKFTKINQRCSCKRQKMIKNKLNSNIYNLQIKPLKNYKNSSQASTPGSSKNNPECFFSNKQTHRNKIQSQQQKKIKNKNQFYNIFKKNKNKEQNFKSQSERFLIVQSMTSNQMIKCISPQSQTDYNLGNSKNQSGFNFIEDSNHTNKPKYFSKIPTNTIATNGNQKYLICQRQNSKERKCSLNYATSKLKIQNLVKSIKNQNTKYQIIHINY